MKRALCLVVATVVLWCRASAQNRAHFAEVELAGPVSGVVLDAGRAGSTRIEGALLAGETRRIVVPVPLDSGLARTDPVPRFDPDPTGGRGRVRFVGWSGAASPLDALAAGLRARALPALEQARVSVSRAAPLVLVLALVIALALRKRPVLALLAALAASGALFPLVAVPARAAEAAVTLFDGDADGALWRRVDAAIDEISVALPAESFELQCDPAAAPITWRVPLDPARPARALAHGARLFVASVVDARSDDIARERGGIARERNDFAPLAETWIRDGGAWREHGAWPQGSPLGPAIGTGAPPGWLASHLPQGVPILIARVEPVAGRTPEWLRISGL